MIGVGAHDLTKGQGSVFWQRPLWHTEDLLQDGIFDIAIIQNFVMSLFIVPKHCVVVRVRKTAINCLRKTVKNKVLGKNPFNSFRYLMHYLFFLVLQ